jgi:putative ABC transport system permease protein
MNLNESFRTAINGLRANRLRSLLTMLGIIIGIAAVIALMSLGNGFDNLVEDEINAVGTNLIFVISDSESGYPTLTEGDLNALASDSEADAIRAVAGSTSEVTEVGGSGDGVRTTVQGVSGNYFALNNLTDITAGQLFDTTDDAAYASVAVLGNDIAADLFDGANPVGQNVTINSTNYLVVAVLETSDSATASTDDVVFIPLNTALQRLDVRQTRFGDQALDLITVQAAGESEVDAALEQISAILRDQHDLVYGAEDDFGLISQAGLLESFGTITETLTLFLAAIAGIALLVGGIGIMNIMLVSVTERTREIGIRKAIGALRRDILSQFLLESLILTLLGGLIGTVLGIGISFIGGAWVDVTAVVTGSTLLLAVGFSVAVGLIFGIYPAWQAAQMRPIQALRYE